MNSADIQKKWYTDIRYKRQRVRAASKQGIDQTYWNKLHEIIRLSVRGSVFLS